MRTISKAQIEAAKWIAEQPRPVRAGTGELVGKIVRAQAPEQGAKMGVVIGQTKDGKCWEIKTPRGMEVYLKEFVQAIPSKMAGKRVRALKAAMLDLGTNGKIYGSGDLD